MSTIQTGITEQVIAWLFDHLPTVYAVGAAVSISALMSLYDGRTLVQTVTGSLACGVLAMAVAGSLRFFGFPEDAVTFIGASIGFMGAEKVDAPRDKCTLSCAINGIHAAFHYLKKNYISGCVMTVPTG